MPAAAAAAFEEAFRRALPQQFDAQPDLLFHLVRIDWPLGVLLFWQLDGLLVK